MMNDSPHIAPIASLAVAAPRLGVLEPAESGTAVTASAVTTATVTCVTVCSPSVDVPVDNDNDVDEKGVLVVGDDVVV